MPRLHSGNGEPLEARPTRRRCEWCDKPLRKDSAVFLEPYTPKVVDRRGELLVGTMLCNGCCSKYARMGIEGVVEK